MAASRESPRCAGRHLEVAWTHTRPRGVVGEGTQALVVPSATTAAARCTEGCWRCGGGMTADDDPDAGCPGHELATRCACSLATLAARRVDTCWPGQGAAGNRVLLLLSSRGVKRGLGGRTISMRVLRDGAWEDLVEDRGTFFSQGVNARGTAGQALDVGLSMGSDTPRRRRSKSGRNLSPETLQTLGGAS